MKTNDTPFNFNPNPSPLGETEGGLKSNYNLPALEIASEVNLKLRDNPCLVVTAPPGAGKSTLLPLTISEAFPEGKIIVLEPRRIAARSIAMRMAEMMGEDVGRTVGYRVRQESRISKDTRIEVLTEGILTRMLVDDPTLEGVSVVIFDEFHERSIHSDVALALSREAQQLLRPDLRIVIMSATIDATSLCHTLSAPLAESKGRMFPVSIKRLQPESGDIATTDDVVSAILRAHREEVGDILVFLPGQGDILRCREQLGDALGTAHICTLYGSLSPKEQHQAIMPSPTGERKVVLATNIAETSLTIEGVRVVIDTGLCRTLVFDSRSGLSHLETVRISLDMATQRTGRAGRVAEGVCYRLWSVATEHRMAENRTPEILEADLAPMLLDVAAWQGKCDAESVASLQWVTPPPTSKVSQAAQLLLSLGAIDYDFKITLHGKRLATMPCHPRIAQMLLKARSADEIDLACDIAAILEEKDPLASEDNDADISTRIIALNDARRRHNPRRWENINRASEQLRNIIHSANRLPNPQESILKSSPTGEPKEALRLELAGIFIASAYPERVAQVQKDGSLLLASGGKATLGATDELRGHDWLAVATLNAQNGGRVFLAAPVQIEDLADLTTERDNVQWDSRNGCIVAKREQRIGRLVISSKPIQDVPKEEIISMLCEAAKKDGLSMFNFDEHVQNLQLRVAMVNTWHPELCLPDVSTDSVLQCAEKWLPFYAGKATTVTELRKIDLKEALWSLLSYEQQQEVERLAPTHLVVPTGSRIRLEYRQGATQPVLRVRLQECFGLTATPCVDDGKLPVLMELLSPGFKPVQLTQDLASFWSETYFEVRKELRRRYPKHHWPDNPLEAIPVRGVKPKK